MDVLARGRSGVTCSLAQAPSPVGFLGLSRRGSHCPTQTQLTETHFLCPESEPGVHRKPLLLTLSLGSPRLPGPGPDRLTRPAPTPPQCTLLQLWVQPARYGQALFQLGPAICVRVQHKPFTVRCRGGLGC